MALAPYLARLSPAPNEGNVAASANVLLDIVDDQGDLVDASVVITVDGVIAWTGDAQSGGFTVTKTAITNGNNYDITPPSAFEKGAVTVRVQADDGTNTLDKTYVFWVLAIGLLHDFFGGVGVNILPGNGTIDASGGRLRIAATAGQNMDWYTFGRNGTVGLVPITKLIEGRSVVYFETELYSWSTTNNTISHTMWGVYLSDFNIYFISTNDGVNWSASKMVGGGWSGLGSYTGNPVAAPPTRIRFKWDIINDTLTAQVYDSGWQDIASDTAGFTPDSVFFSQKNWSSLPAITSEYEYLFVYADDAVAPEDRTEKALVKDTVEFDPTENAAKRGGERFFVGPAKYNQEFGGSLRLPGPPQQQPGSVGPFDHGAAFDVEEHPEIVEGRHRGGVASMGLNLGGLVDKQRIGIQQAGPFDTERALLGTAATYRDNTVDADFNAHFTEKGVRGAFFYDTTNEDWANPVTSLLTGYARDGTRYTAGVQDVGTDTVNGVPNVVGAPWALEAFSTTRGNRDDFPEQALIVWTDNAITIFDVTNFPADLTMWMRFTVNTVALMRVYTTDVKMINGVLCHAHQQSNGGLTLVDFKGDTTNNTAHLIRGDGHWRWNSDITTRNSGSSLYTTSGVSPSLRIDSEYNYNLTVRKEASLYFVGISGEDNTHVVEVDDSQGTVPNRSFPTGETDRVGNIGDARKVTFDEFGWLWQSEQKILVRNATQWRGGGVVLETLDRVYHKQGQSRFYPSIQLPYNITQLAAARDYVYCGTEVGVYRVKRGTLKVELAYTIVGGGGGGRINNPPDGELLLGDTPQILWLHTYSLDGSSYLAVTTYQGAVTIRLYDDQVTQGLIYPALYEHRAYFNTSIYS
jgi:hypothetical protein